MKDSFLKLILDFIKRYPQKYEGKIGYTFAGSISLNLLSCISGNTINMYSFKDFKLKKIKTLKVDNIFKNFFRPISDIDIEVYQEEIFKTVDYKNKILNMNFEFENYSSCFNQNIDKIYLDFFNSKSDYIFELKVNNISIWIDDFRLNYGYRLKTLTNLPNERFNINHPKYKYTISKYSHDIDYLYKIFIKFFGKEMTGKYIKKSLHSFSNDVVMAPRDLKINSLLKKLEMLNISKCSKSFLYNVVETFKIETYNTLFFNENIFLLNRFNDVQTIELIKLGKSKNNKYKIKENNQIYLLKTNDFITEKETINLVNVIKRINKFLPENTQNLEFYGYSKELKKSFIAYKYIMGKSLNECNNQDLYSLGINAGRILSKFHQIPTIGLKLKNESKFLNKIKKCAVKDKTGENTIQSIIKFIKNNNFKLGKNKVLLHNDLNLGNIILSNNKIIFIDFDNCVKGDWFIDFKKKIRNKNDFFEGLFKGYSKHEPSFDKKINLILFLYEYYYMKNLPVEMTRRKVDILKRHKEFLDYFSDLL